MIGKSNELITKVFYSKRSLDDWMIANHASIIDIKFAINPDDTNKTWFLVIYQ